MRKVLVLPAALLVPVVPVLAMAPASATGTDICVNIVAPTCGPTAASITAAIAAANGNSVDDTILVGPGTYKDGPYTLDGTAHGIVLRGSGPGTVLTLDPGAGQTYVSLNGGAVLDSLKVLMNSTTSSGDHGIDVFGGSVAQDVSVDGTGTDNTIGIAAGVSSVVRVDVQMPIGTPGGARGVYSSGGISVVDSKITADTGLELSDPGTTDTVSRTAIHAGDGGGITTDGGTINVDDSLIDLGTAGGTGLRAVNFNNGPSLKSITADHVTIVGGGANSKGAWAYAAASGVKTTAAVTLTNSIVRGPETSLVAQADNDGFQGGPSTANVNVSYTDYQTANALIGTHGAGGITAGAGNLTDVDPAFVGGGDYHLLPASPVIDHGDPGADTHTADLDKLARVVDGDGNGSAIRDLGAYEFQDVTPPDTAITGGPTGPTQDTTPSFTFTSEQGATFACQVDAGAYGACSSPFTAPALGNGAHTFRVRASDAASNTDLTPAVRAFTVDTVSPNTTLTRKPAKVITTRRATFRFVASEPGPTYQCRLDARAWQACASPRAMRVSRGSHVFRVRAWDAAGNVDPTPAAFRFRRA